jgi:predicted dinucleotide-binding enzyme
MPLTVLRRIRHLLPAILGSAALTYGLLAWPGFAGAQGTAAASDVAAPLKIGIIGTGRIGSALARHWAKAGHELVLSSRHPEALQALATELGPRVHVGTPQQAAAFGNVILVSIPYGAMPQVGNDYAKELAGKIIIDTSNPIERRDGAMALEAQRKGVGIATAEYLHSQRVVRAFNCINSFAVTADSFREGERRAIPIGGDDAAALSVVSRLVSDAGFDAVVVGSLARTREFELGEILANRDWSAREFKQQLAK